MYFRRLKDLREDSDLTQYEVAEKLNIAREVYRRYEAGIRTIPVDLLIQLADFYDVSTDYILGISNRKHYNR